jgi:hypothetical protein
MQLSRFGFSFVAMPHGIAPFPKSIGLAQEMALRCRTRRQESGHVSRSVLRTG